MHIERNEGKGPRLVGIHDLRKVHHSLCGRAFLEVHWAKGSLDIGRYPVNPRSNSLLSSPILRLFGAKYESCAGLSLENSANSFEPILLGNGADIEVA